jgi:hypothetical protein
MAVIKDLTGRLGAARFVTHHFGMNEFDKPYEVFGGAAHPVGCVRNMAI